MSETRKVPPPAPDEEQELWEKRNPQLFLLFRIFFNSRFYYPVYALMFIDFGLTQEQFATLNLVWAITIVLLEVPSGALADQLGRRPLIIGATFLMVIELAIMLFMPVVDRSSLDETATKSAVALLFSVFIINRIISGAAEAAASGADEALTYDSLPLATRESAWQQLTARLMRWQSITFIAITLIGAFTYDTEQMNQLLLTLGWTGELEKAQTLKFPIFLTFLMSLGALFAAFRMIEPPSFQKPDHPHLGSALKDSFRRTFAAGRWVLATPAALMLLLVGLAFDSIIRLYYTVNSIWLDVLGFQPASFGVISVVGSIFGFFTATWGAKLIAAKTPGFNFRLIAMLTFIGIASFAFPIQFWSVIFLPTLWVGMRLLHYFLSNYLNRVTPEENRATVLSFRGMTMNLTYGLVTWAYGKQAGYFREQDAAQTLETEEERTRYAFTEAAEWWWVYLLAVIIALWAFRALILRQRWAAMLQEGKEKLQNGG